jgi:hypothetical protein
LKLLNCLQSLQLFKILEENLDAQVKVGVVVFDPAQQHLVVFADEGLAVVASDVVPVDAVAVEVVEKGQAVLRSSVLQLFPVVGLGSADSAGLAPVVLHTVGGGGKLLQLGGPEPAVDALGLQVRAVAALEVTQATGRPDVPHLVLYKMSLDPLVLLGSLQANGVHTPRSTPVPDAEPVLLLSRGSRVLPREEVTLASELLMDPPLCAQLGLGAVEETTSGELRDGGGRQ